MTGERGEGLAEFVSESLRSHDVLALKGIAEQMMNSRAWPSQHLDYFPLGLKSVEMESLLLRRIINGFANARGGVLLIGRRGPDCSSLTGLLRADAWSFSTSGIQRLGGVSEFRAWAQRAIDGSGLSPQNYALRLCRSRDATALILWIGARQGALRLANGKRYLRVETTTREEDL